jgi:hypothetical protein
VLNTITGYNVTLIVVIDYNKPGCKAKDRNNFPGQIIPLLCEKRGWGEGHSLGTKGKKTVRSICNRVKKLFLYIFFPTLENG